MFCLIRVMVAFGEYAYNTDKGNNNSFEEQENFMMYRKERNYEYESYEYYKFRKVFWSN